LKKEINILLFIILATSITGCFIGAGTHGSLKGYQYQTKKDKLNRVVMYVIKNNPKICRDTIGSKFLANVGNGKQDTIIDNSYNDGHEYVSIKIKTQKGQCNYTFRYYGDEEHWKISKTSEIFICWAYDEFGKGGSEGNGGVDSKTLNYLTGVFEKELVSNIDKKLNLIHIDTD
jgi:hypothetical protein